MADKDSATIEAVRDRAAFWREISEMYRESHPEICAWYAKFADELDELLKAGHA